MNSREKRHLADLYNEAVSLWLPPEDLSVDQWADKYRRLAGGLSAEAGQWRTDRTPYMREPMCAFSDPNIEEIVFVAPSQVGKSELELNIIAYIIDQDPGTILYVQPRKEDAMSFSRLRVAPMLKACDKIRDKVRDVEKKGRGATSTVLQKSFPGGMLTLVGSNSASDLSSQPVRYVIGDELDRFALSAGRDGDPWELAKRRQNTFYNRKRVAVSTPTIKGASQIEFLYTQGTRERWKTRCPRCGEYHEVRFDDIQFKAKPKRIAGKESWYVDVIGWKCPGCREVSEEQEVKKSDSRWEAENPDAIRNNRCRSFWLGGFASPWRPWRDIIQNFCKAKKDPERLKVWKNTDVGDLWEERNTVADETELLKRAEKYPENADLPGEPGCGPLILTCGVDFQHKYAQYEIVGWGHYYESWGVQSGYITGSPDSDEVWKQLDSLISRPYKFANGRALRVVMTFADSGDGKFTNEIARRCKERQKANVFAVKGWGTHGRPFITPPNRVPIAGNKNNTYILYNLGVNAGKSAIMSAVQVQEPGPNYMHFPDESRGYDMAYFTGLLSEVEVVEGNVMKWVKLPGHERNEALDCRNYARAAVKVINPDFDAWERALRDAPSKTAKVSTSRRPRRTSFKDRLFD